MRKIKKHFGLSLSRYNTFKAMISLSFIVFLICTTLGVFFFQKISKELKNNFQELNEYIVSIVQTQFQNSLNYSTTIILDPMNQKIIANNYSRDDPYNLSIRLNSFTKTNAIIDSLFIYYPEIDLVVCNSGVYDLKEYYLIEYGYESKTDFDSWKSNILSKQPGFSYDSKFDHIISYTRLSFSSDLNNESNFKQIVVFNFDMSGLTIEDDKAFIDELGFFVDDKLIIIKENDKSIIRSLIANSIDLEFENNTLAVDDNFIYKYPFNFSNLYLITSMNTTSYQSSRFYLILASIFTLLFSFIVSILYSLRESEKLFKPFRDLAYKLSPNKYSKDSLIIINEKIDSLLEEDTFKDDKLKVQFESLQKMFLLKLISEKVSDKYCSKLIKDYDIVFPYSSFYIFVSKENDVNSLITKSKDELFYDISCNLFLIESENELIGFINLEEEINVQDKILSEIEDLLHVNGFDCDLIDFKLSDICLSFSDIYFAYQQCDYLSKNKKGLFSYTDKTKYIIQDLKTSFENNDIKLYDSCIDKVFSNQIFIPSFLLVSLVKEIKQYAPDFDLDISSDKRVSKEVFANLVKGKREVSESQRSLVEKVDQIINNSFKNDSLGLYLISDQLNVSNTYLSTVYKESCGIGIVQKINQKRIAYAKNLLLTTDKSVKEVALSSGFSSDISFIRVFKKIEDLTPGKLRKKNK
ncbi:MAG: helix-turn-helix domain-containing protein [Pleomorphochaeta sp.]